MKNIGRCSIKTYPSLLIWVKPRETIRYLLTNHPKLDAWVIYALLGIGQSLNRAIRNSAGDSSSLGTILLAVAVIGSIGGVIFYYIYSLVLTWVGLKLKGKADHDSMQLVLFWSFTPALWAYAVVIIEIIIFGHDLFKSNFLDLIDNEFKIFVFLGLTFVEIVISIWTLIIFVKAISEVQKFSSFKAIINIILSGIIMLIPALFIFGLIYKY